MTFKTFFFGEFEPGEMWHVHAACTHFSEMRRPSEQICFQAMTMSGR